MITSPVDKQLIVDPSKPNESVRGTVNIRAKVWDDQGVSSATYQIDNGAAIPLTRIGTTQMWSAPWNSAKVSDGDHQIRVNVQGAGGNTNQDKIGIIVNQAGSYQPPLRSAGDNGNSIGTYVEKGLLGTQQGGPGGPGRPKGPGRGPGGNRNAPPPPPPPGSGGPPPSHSSDHSLGASPIVWRCDSTARVIPPSLSRLPLLNSAMRRKSSQLIAIKRSTTENAGSGVPSTCHAGPNPLIQPPITSFMTAYTLCNLQFIRLSVSSLAASCRHVAPLRQ